MKTKICTQCGEEKSICEFHKNKRNKDGYKGRCKACMKAYYDNNKTARIQYQLTYEQNNKEARNAYQKEYQKSRLDQLKESDPEGYEQIKKANREYQKRPEVKQANNKRRRKRYATEPLVRVKELHRRSMRYAFKSIGKKKNCSSIKALGLNNYKEFADYLSNQFYDHPITGEKMTFDNHGSGEDCWQIDHIIPLLTAETEEDVIRLSHYTNLQPLWEVDHVKKTASDLKEYKNS